MNQDSQELVTPNPFRKVGEVRYPAPYDFDQRKKIGSQPFISIRKWAGEKAGTVYMNDDFHMGEPISYDHIGLNDDAGEIEKIWENLSVQIADFQSLPNQTKQVLEEHYRPGRGVKWVMDNGRVQDFSIYFQQKNIEQEFETRFNPNNQYDSVLRITSLTY